jgi:hypothetical protein
MRTAVCSVPRYLLACLAHPVTTGALLFLLVLSGYLLSYNVDKPTHNADWYIRYQVTCSIVERNAFYLNPYDASERTGPGIDGHVYAQYTLGQTTALIPLYLLGRVFAGVAHTNCATRVANPIVFLTCKLLDPILGALLCALFFATARLLGYAPASRSPSPSCWPSALRCGPTCSPASSTPRRACSCSAGSTPHSSESGADLAGTPAHGQ